MGDAFIADSGNDQVLEATPGLLVSVGQNPTSTTVAASVPSAYLGQSETLTATIGVLSGAIAPSAGTVEFFDGATELGTSNVSGGMATFTTSALALGSHTITATYSGATGYLASTSGVEPTSTRSVILANQLVQPEGLALDGMGDLFIADSRSQRVVEVAQDGAQSTIGSGLTNPIGVAVDPAGDVFIADPSGPGVVEVTRSGMQKTIVSGAMLPAAVGVDSAGDVFIADFLGAQVLKLSQGGTPATIGSGLLAPLSLAVDGAGDVFIADNMLNQVLKVTPTGAQTTVASGLDDPSGVAVDSAGDVFITEAGNNQVVEVTPSGIETTVESGLQLPLDVAVDGAGDLFVTQAEINSVLKVTPGVPLTVNPIPTSTSVAASSSSTIFGQAGTFTATISVPSGATPPTTGMATFFDGTTAIGTSAVSGGAATFMTTTLGVGTHTITASFGGTPNYAASTSGVEPGSAQSVVSASGLAGPAGVAVDAANDVYIGDFLNNDVVKVAPSGTQTVIASGLGGPNEVAVDSTGDAFIADTGSQHVLEVTPSGSQTTVGSGFFFPVGVAVGAGGNVFISDVGSKSVVELSTSGTQTVIASNLAGPRGLAIDAKGNIFIADAGSDNSVIELTTSGTESIVASGLGGPTGVAVDNAGDVFIADTSGNRVIEVTASGIETTLESGNSPLYVAVDPLGDLLVTFSGSSKVQKITPGLPVTVSAIPTSTSLAASSASTSFGQTETLTATISVPSGSTPPSTGTVTFFDGARALGTSPVSAGIATFATSNLALGSHTLFASYSGTAIYSSSKSGIEPDSAQSVVPASGTAGPAGVAVDAMGDVFIADPQTNQVLEVTPSGTTTTVGTGLDKPLGVAVDAHGNVFIADTQINRVVEVSASGAQTTFASGLVMPFSVAVDGTGDVFIANSENDQVLELPVSGPQKTIGTDLDIPTGVAVVAAGDVFIAEYFDNTVLKVTPSGTQTTVGSGLSLPNDAAVDSAGDVFIAEPKNNQVLKVTPAGTQTSVGTGVSGPACIAVDGSGDLFISDFTDNRVLKVEPGVPVTVNRAALTLTWPNPADILYGTPLGPTELHATASVPGTFSYTPPLGTVLHAGLAQSLSVTFTPADSTDYAALTATALINVDKASPILTVHGVSTTFDGNPHPATYVITDVNGDNLLGLVTLTYNGAGTVPATAGTYAVTATFGGTSDYNAVTDTTQLVVIAKAAPIVTWAKPADIPFGTALETTQLDATASVPGTFTYSPAAGTVLSPGQGQVLTATFTPADTTDYTTATASTTINVIGAPPMIISEQALFKRQLKHGKPVGNPVLIGYIIDFSSRLNASSACLGTNYQVDTVSTKTVKKKKVTTLEPLTGFTVSYNDSSESVSLLFTSPQTFKTGGQITVLSGPSSGVTGPSGAFLFGTKVLNISPGGKTIALA